MRTLGKMIVALMPVFVLGAPAKSDPARGQALFAACAACHEVGSTSGRTGPSLLGVIGRPAGSLSDFRYSRAMIQSGIVWNEENISKFLQSPQGFVRGNRMPFAGISSERDRVDIINYLNNVSR